MNSAKPIAVPEDFNACVVREVLWQKINEKEMAERYNCPYCHSRVVHRILNREIHAPDEIGLWMCENAEKCRGLFPLKQADFSKFQTRRTPDEVAAGIFSELNLPPIATVEAVSQEPEPEVVSLVTPDDKDMRQASVAAVDLNGPDLWQTNVSERVSAAPSEGPTSPIPTAQMPPAPLPIQRPDEAPKSSGDDDVLESPTLPPEESATINCQFECCPSWQGMNFNSHQQQPAPASHLCHSSHADANLRDTLPFWLYTEEFSQTVEDFSLPNEFMSPTKRGRRPLTFVQQLPSMNIHQAFHFGWIGWNERSDFSLPSEISEFQPPVKEPNPTVESHNDYSVELVSTVSMEEPKEANTDTDTERAAAPTVDLMVAESAVEPLPSAAEPVVSNEDRDIEDVLSMPLAVPVAGVEVERRTPIDEEQEVETAHSSSAESEQEECDSLSRRLASVKSRRKACARRTGEKEASTVKRIPGFPSKVKLLQHELLQRLEKNRSEETNKRKRDDRNNDRTQKPSDSIENESGTSSPLKKLNPWGGPGEKLSPWLSVLVSNKPAANPTSKSPHPPGGDVLPVHPTTYRGKTLPAMEKCFARHPERIVQQNQTQFSGYFAERSSKPQSLDGQSSASDLRTTTASPQPSTSVPTRGVKLDLGDPALNDIFNRKFLALRRQNDDKSQEPVPFAPSIAPPPAPVEVQQTQQQPMYWLGQTPNFTNDHHMINDYEYQPNIESVPQIPPEQTDNQFVMGSSDPFEQYFDL